jgi:hypothetical protein
LLRVLSSADLIELNISGWINIMGGNLLINHISLDNFMAEIALSEDNYINKLFDKLEVSRENTNDEEQYRYRYLFFTVTSDAYRWNQFGNRKFRT